MDSDPKEIELKLRIDASYFSAIRNHPKFANALRNPVKESLVSVYFDSAGMFMRDHGLTLRVRHSGQQRIQTIKAADPRSGIFERSEWEKPIGSDRPDLTDVVKNRPGLVLNDVQNGLRPIFETRVKRTTYRLNGGDTDIAIAFDDGKIVAADSSCPISEIELELRSGRPGELFKIARSIGEIAPACIDVQSKSERGYELFAGKTTAIERAHDPKLPAGMAAGRAFVLIGRACLRQLLVNVSGTKERNSEALHQMRIGLRRLRAAISLFSGIVSDDRIEPIKAELKWLGAELAPARDLDSFLSEALRPLRKHQAGQPGFESISRMFARERLKAYRRAQEAIESPRFRALALDTAEWIEAGPWNISDDPLIRAHRAMPIEILATEQLSRRRKKIRRRGAKVDDLDTEQLHKLRIQIKKTRYATEFFANTYPGKKATKRHEKLHSSLKQLQTCLGGFNDVMTRKALCAEVLEHPGRSLTEEQKRRRAFAAGLIIGDQQAQLRELIDRATKAHSRFDDAKPFWK